MAASRWEYHIGVRRDELAELGEQGWELVAVTVVAGVETFYFKRPAPSLRDQLTLSQREQALAGKEGDGA